MPLPDFTTLRPVRPGVKAAPDFDTLRPVAPDAGQSIPVQSTNLPPALALAGMAGVESPEAHPIKSAVSAIGRGLGGAGQALKDLAGAYAFEATGDTESQARQLGIAPETLTRLGIKNVEPDTGETPLEQGTKALPAALQIPAKAAYGLVETAPRIAAVSALQAGGVPAPIGAAAAFGATEEGFSPKQAIIAAALPFVGKYSGEVAGLIAKKFGVSNTTAINWIKGVAGTATPAAGLIAEQEAEIAKLPKEQQHDARLNMWANVAGQAALGPMGVKFEKAAETKGVPDAIHQESQPVLPSVRARDEAKQTGPEVPVKSDVAPTGERGSEIKPPEGQPQPEVPKEVAVIAEPKEKQLGLWKSSSGKPSWTPDYFAQAGDSVYNPDWWVNLFDKVADPKYDGTGTSYQIGKFIRELGQEKGNKVIDALEQAREKMTDVMKKMRDPNATKEEIARAFKFGTGAVQLPREAWEAAMGVKSAEGELTNVKEPPIVRSDKTAGAKPAPTPAEPPQPELQVEDVTPLDPAAGNPIEPTETKGTTELERLRERSKKLEATFRNIPVSDYRRWAQAKGRWQANERRVRELESESGQAAIGMGAATPGNFPQPPSAISRKVGIAQKALKTARTRVASFLGSGKIRDALTLSRDSSDTHARIYARQSRHDIEGPLRREFTGKGENAKAQEALSFVRESGESEDVLREMKDKIQNSTKADPTWARKAIDDIDYALYNFKRLTPFSQQYRQAMADHLTAEHAEGFETPPFENYVPHRQDIDTSMGFPTSAPGDTPGGFRHMRTHATFADSIAAGVDPKSLNALDLMESRLNAGQRMINNKAWTDNLRTTQDPVTNLPLATDPVVRKRQDGTTDTTAPRGYSLERIGNQFLAVHNGYEGIISALTEPSWWAKSPLRQNFLKTVGVAKSINLMIDTYHLGRVAFIQSAIKMAGLTTMKAPIPSFEKGVMVLDYTPKEITAMANAGEITPEQASWILSKKADAELLTVNGMNVGRIADSLYQDWIHDLPMIGKANKWIFDSFQRGAMTEAALLELDRQRGMYPELTDAQVARQVAKDINTRFGQLGRQGIFKSRTAQDIARVLFFAPQWNEGLIRSELGAIKQLGKATIDAVTGKRLAAGLLARTAGVLVVGQFVANQIINMITRGHPTWENKEEGIGAKLSAWIPDKIGSGHGFFLNPLALGAEISHLLLNRYEKTSDWRKTLNDFMHGRLSNAMKPLFTFATNTDRFGRGIKQGDVWKEMALESIPTPIPASAAFHAVKQAVTGKSSEAFPGQFEKQLLASAGIRTDYAPAEDQRISALAKEYNRKHGIVPSAEFYTSDYQPFIVAMRAKNKEAAASAMDELLGKKTLQQAVQHFRNWANYPFTGQRSREAQFYRGLSDEQKSAYKKAVEERKRIARESLAMLRERAQNARKIQEEKRSAATAP